MLQALIETVEVVKDYHLGSRRIHALRGISVTIEPGEFVAVMGPSGSGKSTFMNLLGCLDTPSAGLYRLDGLDVSRMGRDALARVRNEKIGFVFQTFNLLPVITALENVELTLLVSGVRPGEARRRAGAALAQVGLSDRMQHRPAELSGGQRQRVTIARSLVNEPAIVWADEPTGSLDSEAANDVLGLMRRLNRERGQTLVIVTHDLDIGGLCDRIVRMRDGQIVEYGRGHEPATG